MAPDEQDPTPPTAASFGFPEDGREAKGSILPDFVRKVAVAGLGALFMTEEGLRSVAGQLKVPKEMLGYVVAQAEKTKDEIGRVVSEEVRRFLQSDRLREEFVKLLAGMTLEIKAEVRMVPGGKSSEGETTPSTPELKVTDIHTKRGKRSRK